MGDCQLARDFAVTDWLTVISRYFGGNPYEGSDFIRKGFVASATFMLYTRKINPIFSDIQTDWSRPMGFYPSLQGLPYPYVCYVCLCVSHFPPRRGSQLNGPR